MVKILDETAVDDILAVESACFSTPWDKSVLVGTINQKSYHFFGAYCDKKLVGYCSATVVADECYVNRIAVMNDFRHRGFADELMKSAIMMCRENKCSFISLEVRKSNNAAISLYIKHGFETVGERKKFYDNPTENALIMTLKF